MSDVSPPLNGFQCGFILTFKDRTRSVGACLAVSALRVTGDATWVCALMTRMCVHGEQE